MFRFQFCPYKINLFNFVPHYINFVPMSSFFLSAINVVLTVISLTVFQYMSNGAFVDLMWCRWLHLEKKDPRDSSLSLPLDPITHPLRNTSVLNSFQNQSSLSGLSPYTQTFLVLNLSVPRLLISKSSTFALKLKHLQLQ